MKNLFITESRARLRTWLAVGYALFIAYASLSPFSGWREQGLDFFVVLRAPLLLTYTPFDATINLLAYLFFGLLAGLALHARLNALASIIIGFGMGVSLSVCMEYLQMYLPMRVSSNMDILSNSAGALTGVLLAVRVAAWPWLFNRLTRWRNSLFLSGKEIDFGLALLLLWIFGQVNPSLPMLGNVFISEVSRQPFVVLPPVPFGWWACSAVVLNLLLLGVLLISILRLPHDVIIALPAILILVALAKFILAALLLKSWALLLWINSEAVLGMLIGTVLLFAFMSLPQGVAFACGAAAALAYFVVVNLLAEEHAPAAAMSVYHWHYRHLLNYNGLAQTIYLVFPLLLMLHLWGIRKT